MSELLSELQHPYGVKPSGNAFMHDDPHKSRNEGLGTLSCLLDETLLAILEFCNAKTLSFLSETSTILYAFAHFDDLWRTLVLIEMKEDFESQPTWKQTYVVTCLQRKGIQSSISFPSICCRELYSDALYLPWLWSTLELKQSWIRDTDQIERRVGLSVEEFVDSYEKTQTPVVICDIVSHWPAFKKWSLEYLRSQCGDVRFSVAGFSFRMEEFCKYMKARIRDDQPLYLFDKHFASRACELARDYIVPIYFQNDLFDLLEEDRPDFRWIILGTSRSGSSFHKDPNATSAWNAVISGAKKWIMYPPDQIPPGVHPSADGSTVATPVSLVEWFANYYQEHLLQVERAKESCSRGPIEFVAKAGDLVFVPSGWWHMVINLEDGIAITQNYVSTHNLPKVLHFLRSRVDQISGVNCEIRQSLYNTFVSVLQDKAPEIWAQYQLDIIRLRETRSQKTGVETKTSWTQIIPQKRKNSSEDTSNEKTRIPFSFGFSYNK